MAALAALERVLKQQPDVFALFMHPVTDAIAPNYSEVRREEASRRRRGGGSGIWRLDGKEGREGCFTKRRVKRVGKGLGEH